MRNRKMAGRNGKQGGKRGVWDLRRIAAVTLAAVMAFGLAGCAADKTNEAGTQPAADAAGGGAQGQGGASSDGQTAMGRYVEQEIDLSGQLSTPAFMGMREDGSLVIMDTETGIFVSKDGGATWTQDDPAWYTAMKAEETYYVSGMAMLPDGTAAVVYVPDTESEDWQQEVALYAPDGTEIPLAFTFAEEDGYARDLEVNTDGRFFVRTNRSVYELHPDGSGGKVLTPDESSHVWAHDNLLYIDCEMDGMEMPTVYDMDAEEYIADAVLADFVQKTYGGRYYNGHYYATMSLLPADDGTVYLFGPKGIHRHSVGGNMVEQVVDGALSHLSNPDYALIATLQIADDEFLALCAGSKLLHFTYDPDVPTVPENILTVYSLEENDDIRQAISYFQTQNPEWFVSYEIGIEDGAVTRDDALKKLNTEIMAGTGPDLLVLDGLPMDSYIEKGLLLDLTDYFAQYSQKEPLFDNVIEALKVDGRAYMAPAVMELPVLGAQEKYVTDMTDLSGVADALERMRADYPGENLTGMVSSGEVLKRFVYTSAPLWIAEDGTLDMEVIRAYLEQCKRIYDAQMDGLDKDILAKYMERNERLSSYEGIDLSAYEASAGNDVLEVISGEQHMASGDIDNMWYYTEMLGLERAPGCEDVRVVPMQGQCTDVFKPRTMLAISAASAQPDAAKSFMDLFLSAESQANYNGFPLNQAAFDKQLTPPADLGENNVYGTLTSSYGDEEPITLRTYWPTEEETAAFKERLALLKTAYITDSVLEGTVFQVGSGYFNGERKLEDALAEIEKRAAIYMAE